MNKKEIINYISTMVNFCIADGNTYLYAKCVPTVKHDSKKVAIGGGNFTVLLSTLACLEFLATINTILNSKDDDFYTENEIKQIEEQSKTLTDNLKSILRVPKKGELKSGTGKTLRGFLEETLDLTGTKKKDAGKIQSIRNKLAHEFTPKIISAAGVPLLPGVDFVNLILNYKNQPVFCLTSENSIGIDSNALNHKLSFLLQYIIERIEPLDESDKKLKRISEYIHNTK